MGDDQPASRLDVAIVDASGRALRVPGLARWLAGISPRRVRGTVTIALVSDSRMRALNRQYRGQDYPTDVLSFPAAPMNDPSAAMPSPGSRLPARRQALGSRSPAPARRAIAARHAHAAVDRPHSTHRVRFAPDRAHPEPPPVHPAHPALHPAHPARRTPRTARIHPLGDIVIARGVAGRQARRAGHALSAEYRVLALHGLLHLLGYDHEADDGAMRRVEARLRRRGGLPGGLIERAVR